jgi:putative ABC transport system ATP-binding protein
MLTSGKVSLKALVGSKPMASIIEAEELYRFYHVGDEEVRALRGVSLSISAGEMVAIMGPSGSGKSTLLACLTGLDEPDGGWVNLCGKRMTRHSETERARLRTNTVGILLQSRNLFDHLTLEMNIRLAQRLAGKFDDDYLTTLLDKLGLTERRHYRPAYLSGGEAARAGLAVALATHPSILIADEPTGEVDTATDNVVMDHLQRYHQSGGTLLLATHSQAIAAQSDRIIHLLDGKVCND